MITEPKLEDRNAQPYVGIRTQVPMKEFKRVVPQLLGEVFAWLEKQGVPPAGAPCTHRQEGSPVEESPSLDTIGEQEREPTRRSVIRDWHCLDTHS